MNPKWAQNCTQKVIPKGAKTDTPKPPKPFVFLVFEQKRVISMVPLRENRKSSRKSSKNSLPPHFGLWPKKATGIIDFGSILVTFWLLPDNAFHWITTEWKSDFSIFFLSGSMVVTGSVLVVMNNSQIILGLAMRLLVGFHQLAPVLKSAVSYPLRSRFRTGLSVAMRSMRCVTCRSSSCLRFL